MRKIWLIALGALMLVPGAAAAKAGKEAAPAKKHIVQMMREHGFKHKTASWTTQTSQKDDTGKVVNSEGKMWIDGDKYRMESKNQQDGKQMVLLDDGQEMYMYTPADRKAIKWSKSMEAMYSGMMSSDIVAESARQRKTAKKVGAEAIDGKPCDIYVYKQTVTFMQNQVTSDVKEWFWAPEKFPIKTVVNTPKYQMKMMFISTDVPASETTSVIKDLKFDAPLDAGLFALPAGTKVETMEMPPAMGGGGEEAEPPAKAGKAKPAAASEEGSEEGGGGEEPKQPPVDVNKMLKGLF
jgi:outer membrane lipoprotein-sorting protein